MLKKLRTWTFLVLAVTLAAMPVRAEMQLVLIEEQGCMWCEKWDEEIAEVYPKTTEGKRAPLRRIDIHDTLPDDLKFSLQLNFTPTFVLFVHGVETGRIEGYPGEDFFWGLLAVLINEAEEEYKTGG